MRLAVILLAVSLLRGQTVESYLQTARQAEAAGDFAAAERNYEKALALRRDAATYQRLGLVRHLQNKFAEAIPAFQRSLQLQPDQWPSHLFLGMALYRTNRFDEAFAELKQTDKLHPGDPEVRFWLGVTALARRDTFFGLATLEGVLQQQPRNAEALRILAENYATLGTTLLNRVAEQYPDSLPGLQVHAQALELEGATEAALAVYQDLAARQPNRPGVQEAIARLRAISGEPRPPSPPAAGGESPVPP